MAKGGLAAILVQVAGENLVAARDGARVLEDAQEVVPDVDPEADLVLVVGAVADPEAVAQGVGVKVEVEVEAVVLAVGSARRAALKTSHQCSVCQLVHHLQALLPCGHP
jgi:hypothetical protein|mmetsp:Transcript_98160/g.155252  ORF Transcript_98160/g.155252 Transcript_98160/m.155252 type:complete len:109 (+) Transcript_98160:1500-1826(+)